MTLTEVRSWLYPLFMTLAVGALVVATTIFLLNDSEAAMVVTLHTLAVMMVTTGIHDWRRPANRISRSSAMLRIAGGTAFLVVSVWTTLL